MHCLGSAGRSVTGISSGDGMRYHMQGHRLITDERSVGPDKNRKKEFSSHPNNKRKSGLDPAIGDALSIRCHLVPPLNQQLPNQNDQAVDGPSHSRVSPNAHLTMEQPALMVSCAPATSKLGFTSTKSSATKLPVSCTHSAMKSPSRSVRPPRTGVPLVVEVSLCLATEDE